MLKSKIEPILMAELDGKIEPHILSSLIERTYDYLKKSPSVDITDKIKMMILYVAKKIIPDCQIVEIVQKRKKRDGDEVVEKVVEDYRMSADRADTLLEALHNLFADNNLAPGEDILFAYICNKVKKSAFTSLHTLIHNGGIVENEATQSSYKNNCDYIFGILQPLFGKYKEYRSTKARSTEGYEIPYEAHILVARLIRSCKREKNRFLYRVLRPSAEIKVLKRKKAQKSDVEIEPETVAGVDLFEVVNYLLVIHHVVTHTISPINGLEIFKSISAHILNTCAMLTHSAFVERVESNGKGIINEKRMKLVSLTEKYYSDIFWELIAESGVDFQSARSTT